MKNRIWKYYLKLMLGGFKMKFAKGVILGSLVTAGAMMMYSQGIDNSKKKIMRKGRQFARKIKFSM